jgi:hypothetical protein
MLENERQDMLRQLEEAKLRSQKMSREEALNELVRGGFLTADGELSPKYGGKASSAA